MDFVYRTSLNIFFLNQNKVKWRRKNYGKGGCH